MSKPPPKGATGTSRQAQPSTTAGKVYQTRSQTVVSTASKASPQRGQTVTNPTQSVEEVPQHTSPLLVIARMLTLIASDNTLATPIKRSLDEVILFASKAVTEESEGRSEQASTAKVSEIRSVVRTELARVHNSLIGELAKHFNAQAIQINGVQDVTNAILTGNDKILKVAEAANAEIKEVTGKVTKVTDTTDKIISDSKTYRDALLKKPAQTNRAEVDPKVLSDLDRKAKQVLVDVYGDEGDALLSQSLTAIVDKANEVIASINDAAKPTEVKVVTAFKTRGKAILLTLNSKEAVEWIREAGNEIAFTKALSKESQIRQRSFNLILPGIPITFDPDQGKHLREVEEVNGLSPNSIRKARWIKPLNRRRPDQTHAYAILSLFTADDANGLIRNGLVVCGASVRPRKQKQEPMQCMKCRRWGHLATDCSADADTCGRCGDKHRTNMCSDRNKTYCVNCEDITHPSWSRECPEFSRRCLIFDERIPENAMPYFPTEHDWTLITRPAKVPLADRFPKKYAVNSPLPRAVYGNRGRTHQPAHRERGKTGANKGSYENANHTPLGTRARRVDPPDNQAGQTAHDDQTLEYADTDEMHLTTHF
jgi:hypothetical protein